MAEARSRLSPRRVLTPFLGLLDRSSRVAHQRPGPSEDGTRFPEFPWDLRTIILLFPPEAPFRFMNLNLLLGLTGAPFDRPEELGALNAGDAVDLQFCLEGRERCVTYKRYHSIARELSYRPAAVEFILGERLRLEGSWPAYRIRYRQPEANLSLTLHFDSQEDFHWWAHAPRLYCHYTSFGRCRMEWQWESEGGALEVPALHDHGWGRNLLPLGVPLRTFRYEVLQLRSETENIERACHLTLDRRSSWDRAEEVRCAPVEPETQSVDESLRVPGARLGDLRQPRGQALPRTSSLGRAAGRKRSRVRVRSGEDHPTEGSAGKWVSLRIRLPGDVEGAHETSARRRGLRRAAGIAFALAEGPIDVLDT